MRRIAVMLMVCGSVQADVLTNLPSGVLALYNGTGSNSVWVDMTTNDFHLTSSNPPTRSAPGYTWDATATNMWSMDGAYSTNFTVPALTLVAYFRTTSDTPSRAIASVFRGGGEPYSNQVGVIMALHYNEPGYWTNGGAYFRVTDGLTDNHQYVVRHSGPVRHDDARWHTVIGTVETSGVSHMFVDGYEYTNVLSDASATMPLTWPKRGTYDPTMTVGSYRQTVESELLPYYPFRPGQIGVVAFWPRALTQGEIETVVDAIASEYAHKTRTAAGRGGVVRVIGNQLIVSR